MNVVFMGTPAFAVPVLEAILNEGYTVSGVVTQPDRPKGRKKQLTLPPVKETALAHDLPVLQPETLKDDAARADILNLAPDVIITCAYGQLLPEAILNAPVHGCINVHASLLPKYRGGAPIHRAIMNGENETGVTIMYMVKKLDAGDMLKKESLSITAEDTTGTLHDRLSTLGARLLLETLTDIQKGTLTPEAQVEADATFAPNLERGEEKIAWTMSCEAVLNHIRGMNPWPVAYTTWQGETLKVWQARPAARFESKAEAGTVLRAGEEGLIVQTGGQPVQLTEVQPAGKKAMAAEDFLRGRGQTLTEGEVLGT
ncbi:methionyl-tRNA formyltransferase [Salsuginibacillus halophilus]|uniref:Methionyl-tRNA formyltransferase n=1 Tax=Salsuginibacillus halophilus TaxID=517424 RepID=A0A2P8HY38_9BACI|nr:methionyl-tRNA formyltransferase [Salsuginibacillus halophilus]PSL51140.1 methionyl-tRNA formyltransferase [Salsuginibacillus halophilus]